MTGPAPYPSSPRVAIVCPAPAGSRCTQRNPHVRCGTLAPITRPERRRPLVRALQTLDCMSNRLGSSMSLLVVIAALSSAGCSVGQKRTVLETAFDERERRHEYFEATLRVLDEKPEYVDEFFALANKHPKTLDRFIANTSRELRDEKLAAMTAKHLAANPESLKQVLVQTLEAAKLDANARAAIASAIEEKSELSADIITDSPSATSATFESTVAAIADKPEARAAFLASMQRTSPAVAEYLSNNPETLKTMTKAFLKVTAKNSKAKVREALDDLDGDEKGR